MKSRKRNYNNTPYYISKNKSKPLFGHSCDILHAIMNNPVIKYSYSIKEAK